MPPRDDGLRVVIAADGMSATLIIRSHFDPSCEPEAQIRAALQQRDVAITAHVLAAIEEALAQRDAEEPQDYEIVVARGLPPRHGTLGSICFEEKFRELARLPIFRGRTSEPDPPPAQEPAAEIDAGDADGGAAADAEPDEEEGEAAVDYRQRTNLLIVEAGERIARIVPPVEGCDGVDVRGKVLACKQPQPFELSHDDSIVVQADGAVVARHAGMLLEDGGKLKVERELRIRDYVDFNTGNIRFNGDVQVGKGVRDGFIVDVDGSLVVAGLIEAAVIRTTGDARFGRGMAGREKGTIQIGASLSAHYLDSVSGTVGLDLLVDKEIVHSRLCVGRRLRATHATLIGGCVSVAGPVELKVLGAPSQITTLRVGRVESLDDLLDQTWEKREKVAKRLAEAKERHDVFKRAAGKIIGSQVDELTQLVFEVQSLQRNLEKLDKAIADGEATVSRLAQVDVHVENMIHAKTILQIRRRCFRFKQAVRGPVCVVEDAQGRPQLVDVRSGASSDLIGFAVEEDSHDIRRAS